MRSRLPFVLLAVLHHASTSHAQVPRPRAAELASPIITSIEYKDEVDTLNRGLVRLHDVTVRYDFTRVPEFCQSTYSPDFVSFRGVHDDEGDFEYETYTAYDGTKYMKVLPDGEGENGFSHFDRIISEDSFSNPTALSHQFTVGEGMINEEWPTHLYFYIDFEIFGGIGNTTTCWSRVGNVVRLPGPTGTNQPPAPVGTLPPLTIGVDEGATTVDVSSAFRDPDGDRLTYGASSSRPSVASVAVSGSRVTVTPVSEGTATVTVTATDPDGSNTSASQTFTVTVNPPGPVSTGDRAALEALYDATGGPGWRNSTNWGTSAALGEWYGVTTDADGQVTGLSLVGNGLSGVIPSALQRLEHLNDLVLFNNALTGPVPAWLGNMTRLRRLNLAGNDLTGPIPDELGRLANLEELRLYSNELVGGIPATLGNLRLLVELTLFNNALTGPIPGELGQLVNLEQLLLYGNALTGRIPAELGNLANVWWLSVSGNSLTGAIPTELGNLTSVRWLNLAGNALTGRIPAELGNLASLERLFLSGNLLAGLIPLALGNLASLERLFLSGNLLAGPIPLALCRFRDTINPQQGDVYLDCDVRTNRPPEPVGTLPARTIAVDGAPVAVEVSDAFRDPDGDRLTYRASSSRPSVASVAVSGSRVTVTPVSEGTATVTVTATDVGGSNTTARQTFAVTVNPPPLSTADREALETLYDATGGPGWRNSTNWLTDAPLGEWFGVTTGPAGQVMELDLNNNDLAGTIPNTLAGLVHLERLILRGNELTGGVPEWLGNLVGLRRLDIANNPLGGSIPSALGRLANLEQLHLYNNGLGGEIPEELRNLVNLTDLVLNSNFLTGRIPEWLGDLRSLWRLSLSRNGLSAPIPRALGDLTNLSHLYLQGLELTGPIPTWLGGLGSLRELALSENELTGPIPSELGGLANLRRLWLNENPLTGSVPGSLTQLSLDVLWIHSTGVCVPEEFQAWVATIGDFRGSTCSANRPPEPVGTLTPLTIELNDTVPVTGLVEVSGAFRDPDGDRLTYGASSSRPSVASVAVSGSRVTVTPVSEGMATVTVTATDRGGSNSTAVQSFTVTVDRPFTDHPIVPGVTPVRAVHFTELRTRVDGVRSAVGLGPFAWTDSILRAGVTRVRLVHLLELRSALAEAYRAAGRPAPVWTDGAARAGRTPIRAAHLMELRAAVAAGSVSPPPPPPPARTSDLNTVVTGISVDGRNGRWLTDRVPGESGGPSISAAGNTSAVNGGTADLTVTGGAFSGIVVSDDADAAGYYDVPTGTATGRATLRLAFAQEIDEDSLDLYLAARDASGRIGPAARHEYDVIEVGTGDVQVTLTWDADSDVDLHVVEPGGDEIYWGNPSSTSGGTLDLDSNAACRLDGVRNENITWPAGAAPRGTYTVRVNYWAACDVAATNYTVRINSDGSTRTFSGTLTGDGERGGLGAGMEIATFTRTSGPVPRETGPMRNLEEAEAGK